MSKPLRQKTILEVLERSSVSSQEDLQRALSKRGLKVGQATLSREIHELGLVKTGSGYVLPGEALSEPALPPVSRLVREFVLEVKAAQNLLVIKTTVGSAQPVAAALDGQDWEEAIGTIAGDDTILMVCSDNRGAKALAARIQEILVMAAKLKQRSGRDRLLRLRTRPHSAAPPRRGNSGDASAFRRICGRGQSRGHVSRALRQRRLPLQPWSWVN
jgi:transcriptional regulator of arginine metabolism